MKTSEIRQQFLDFFAKRGHTIVPSSPLVPANDPTLLFTNAGMVQFKEVFLGLDARAYVRATSAQRCVRAGGKHNDLENVGYTARHHTFFEMLGNFSFGDYFKREAIHYAWEFVTKVLGLPKERLWITIFQEDDESAEIWLNEIKINPQQFRRCGEKDNFWSMGDTGPCGPCSEIFYDHGPNIAGGPPGSATADGDRFVEIWNLVFMQYDRAPSGDMSQLPRPSVDTGMGLERIAAVMQGVHNNYDIDIFKTLIAIIAQRARHSDRHHTSLKVIADHIRSCAFLIADGVLPSNEGRGYVLRRIIRRAIRHGNKLGLPQPFFYNLVAPLIEIMGDPYPELSQWQPAIEKILRREEAQFDLTLKQGLKILAQDLKHITNHKIPGKTLFKLYDTYGFPVDLTGDIAREKGLTLDLTGFHQAMAQQRLRSQAASQFTLDHPEQAYSIKHETKFTGYESLKQLSVVKALFQDEKPVDTLHAGEQGTVILDCSPFYATGGGQIGDCGNLRAPQTSFTVTDTQKQGQAHLHIGKLTQGTLRLGDSVEAKVDAIRRQATVLNHSATHLLNAALRQILGAHVLQKGSLVAPDKLRFDFTHYELLTQAQINAIERLTNQKIRANLPVTTAIMTATQAKESGALALFDEKYGERVRVLSMGDFSKELCGGTHVNFTGEIGLFKIIAVSGIAAGVRRIEAVTGEAGLDWLGQTENQLTQIAQMVKSEPDRITDKLQQILIKSRSLEKKVSKLETQLIGGNRTDLLSRVTEVDGIKVLATSLVGVEPKSLRNTLDQLKNKLDQAVIVLASIQDDRVYVVAGISKSCLGKVPSSLELVRAICGKGGGRADMAQGGGKVPPDIEERLAAIKDRVKAYLT